MKYRAEIDGLRAVAVVPVILFHAGFELFSGGFIGVDVFFVISGYLITAIMIEDMEKKRFSVLNFYERRARRILPALFFVMLVCVPFAWIWMLPDPLENFGQSPVAATLSTNNILLYLTSGYWDLASEFKPLLHTWTLGVEEQYYIFFPLILICMWRFGRDSVLYLIIFIAVTSFLLSEWQSHVNPEAAFFLIHTRAWELFAGSIVAFIVQKRGVQKNSMLALLGIILILIAIFTYDEFTPIPGMHALLPVLGVVLLILYADRDTFAAKILSFRLFVLIGAISYSAYLWHQPIFSFAKIFLKTEPTFTLNLVLVFLTFALSYCSWRYIEAPFRDKSKVSGKILLSAIFTSSIVLVGFGYSAHKSHGFVSRVFDESISPSDMYISYNQRNFYFKVDEFQTESQLKILVLGNSYGRDFVNVLRETYSFSKLELIYRDDYDICTLFQTENGEKLFSKANVIIFASNYDLTKSECINNAIKYSQEASADLFFVGNKQFGFNQNWITRTDPSNRKLLRNPVLISAMNADKRASEFIPSAHYISIMQPLTNNEGVLITDELGRLISPDRAHLTKYGAIYIGREIVMNSILGSVLGAVQN